MSSLPTDEVLERVYRRARAIKIRRRLTVAIPLALLLVVFIAAVPSLLDAGERDSSNVVTDEGAQTTLPPFDSVFYGSSASEAGGSILQIDAATMSVRTTYTVPRNPGTASRVSGGFSPPDKLRLSPDGSTLYFQLGGGTCGEDVMALEVDDPSSARVVIDSPEFGIGSFAPTPDGRLVWHRCDFSPAGEGAIVITNLATGEDEITIPYDMRWGTPFFAMSPDGQTVAVEVTSVTPPAGIRSEIRLLPIDGSTSLIDAPIVQPAAGCSYRLPEFNPRSGELDLLEHCGGLPAQGGRLVAVDVASGVVTQTLLDVTPDTALFQHALDSSGEHLLYTMGRAMNPTGRVLDGTSPETFLRRPGQADVPISVSGAFVFRPSFASSSTIEW